MTNIRDEIVAHRRSRIANEGHTLGARVPSRRQVPLVPLLGDPPLICEVKRRSPSRGEINATLDPVELAGTYVANGARSISVLTEENYFHGSLDDLITVKRAHPECAVLRKDFLVDRQDIEVSYRAGADAVLLIAAVLSDAQLEALVLATQECGMTALVELHDADDVDKARPLQPEVIGINARNLSTFAVDLLAPLRLRHLIDWKHRAVFESGIFGREDARLVAQSGFDAVLVGEAVVREPDRIREITAGLLHPRQGVRTVHPVGDFWYRLAGRNFVGNSQFRGPAVNLRPRDAAAILRPRDAALNLRPLVKICGITNREDAEIAVALGADILGFVFADSPRRVDPQVVESLGDLDVLKAAVVVTGGDHGAVAESVAALLAAGFVDAVQFHGDERPEECASWAYPYYRALRLSSPDDVAMIRTYGSPRVLVDARVADAYGGTGKQLAPELINAVAEVGPLWLAGGLDDDNIGEIVRTYRPELVDASSGLELSPGRKDHQRLERFFKELTDA
ncbi:MAG: bifunctional indole-3-glycerol phosphate synthase/phosphoribosylanthranilate isomerase [Spirochaetales bacterium]|nr:bifunctional indole-3-glycerol phosphate synthase/phosphoribosylanthranilate isomerase [Spirochaetales bacterium]